MRYIPLDKVFKYNGKLLIVKRPPKTGWKCSRCALEEDCGQRNRGSEFPECSPERREDGQDVRFSLYIDQRRRTAERFKEDEAR